MIITHLIKHAVAPDFEGNILPAKVVYCGADDVLRHSDHTDNEVPVNGWCTVEFVLREEGEYEDIYGDTTLCPDCLNHPDVAMAFLGEL
jgi:hypothetical protein